MIDYYDPNDPWRYTGYDPYHDLNDEERQRASCMGALAYAAAMLLIFIILALMSSCTTTKYVPIIEHHTDTIIKTNVQKDSVFVHDSISVWQKGDSVTIDRWHTRYVEKQVYDTCYVSRVDSIPKPYPVEVKVEKQLSAWQSFRMSLGSILLWVIGIIAAVYLAKYLLKKYLP